MAECKMLVGALWGGMQADGKSDKTSPLLHYRCLLQDSCFGINFNA
jgi:hypothetical protein